MDDKLSLKKERADDENVLFPEADNEAWLTQHDEGRLAVDVLETDDAIVIRSPIAGVKPDDLEVSVHNDMLTIRGQRHFETEQRDARQLIRECHWGAFSRSIILPAEVDAEKIDASMKDGVLTVSLPKVERSRKIPVKTNK